MKYDLANPLDALKYKAYANKLLTDKKKVELKALQLKRSLSNNAYLHVVISLYSINFGYTLAESKVFLKRECSFMRYEKKGIVFLRETSKMEDKEVCDFTDWIRTYSVKNGLYIANPEEYKQNRITIDKEIDKHKQYL